MTLLRTLGIASLLLASSTVLAAPEPEGFGAWIIDALFEAGSLTSQPTTQGLIGTVITPLNLMLMLVACVVIVFKSIQHLLIVAQAKEIDASPISMTWAPLHLVTAVMLIMPWPSGYSAGQYFAIWLGHQSNILGNVTSSRAANYFAETGPITPPPLPAVQDMVRGAIASNLCMQMTNHQADYMQNQGGVPIRVNARPMTPAEFNASSLETASDLTTQGILFERTRSGGFISEGVGLNNYCGQGIVQFKSDVHLAADANGRPQDAAASPSACETGFWGVGCWFGLNADIGDARKNLVNTFSSAHNTAADALLNIALDNQSGASTIAQNLLFDLPVHFAGRQDTDAAQQEIGIQAEESRYIDQAVMQTVELIGEVQGTIYSGYAAALREHMNQENSSQEDWIEVIDRVGWPIFGLYWFQMTNSSQRVMEAVGINAQYSSDAYSYITRFSNDAGDQGLAYRLQLRYAEYERRLAEAIRNTRLDPTPLIKAERQQDADSKIREAQNALEVREFFPMVKNDMLELASSGATNPTGAGQAMMGRINEFMRGSVFPMMISGLREDNIVTSLVNTGHNIISVSEMFYVASVAMRARDKQIDYKSKAAEAVDFSTKTITTAISWGKKIAGWVTAAPAMAAATATETAVDTADHTIRSSWLGNTLLILVGDALSYWKYVFFLGLFLAFYLPAMIMIQWLIGLVTWVIYIVEATIVIPLWGLLFVGDMGEKAFAPSTARQGFVHMLSILVYPALMVIGFAVGLKVIDLGSIFLVDFLMVGFLNSTDGYLFGLLSMVFGLFIIGFACYQIIMRVFSIVLELNDRAMSWIGQRHSYGESNVEGQVRGGFMAVIGKAEMAGRQKEPGKPQGKDGQMKA